MAGQYSNFKVTCSLINWDVDQKIGKFPWLFKRAGLISQVAIFPFSEHMDQRLSKYHDSESTTSWIFVHGTTFFAHRKLGYILLIGGFNPSEKYAKVSWDDDIPIYEWKKYQIHVPNHQPDNINH